MQKFNRIISDALHIDGISQNGHIRGWGYKLDEKPCLIRVTVDSEVIGEFPANKFRLDLFN